MTDRARILFVDDEKRVLNSMRGLFRREYDLFLANAGSEAIKIASENDIDVIVADQRMPGMTGIEVLAKMKEKSPRTVRILLTGYADPSAVEGSINLGEVFRFLSKPCPPKVLREALSLAISASRTAPVQASAAPLSQPPADRVTAAESTAAPDPVTAPRAATAPTTHAPQVAIPAAAPPAPPPVARPMPFQAPAAAVRPAAASAVEMPTISDTDETQPALKVLGDSSMEATGTHETSHWQTVTNVVMSEDTVEETQENLALTSSTLGMSDVGVVVFTVDSEFAATAIRAVSADRNTALATTLVKVAQAIHEQNAGVLVTDFTTNSAILQKIIGVLKKHLPELVTIVVSNGRDTTDMINLINYGQVFRYVLKPIDPEQLRHEINEAVIRHLYLLNNPESLKRHGVVDTPETGDSSQSIKQFIGHVQNLQPKRRDPSGSTG